MKIYSILTVFLTTLLLTACNSEPSQDDIYTAFKSVVDRSNASMKALNSSIPEKDLLKIDYVKKLVAQKKQIMFITALSMPQLAI